MPVYKGKDLFISIRPLLEQRGIQNINKTDNHIPQLVLRFNMLFDVHNIQEYKIEHQAAGFYFFRSEFARYQHGDNADALQAALMAPRKIETTIA